MGFKFQLSLFGFKWNTGFETSIDKDVSQLEIIQALAESGQLEALKGMQGDDDEDEGKYTGPIGFKGGKTHG